MEVNNMLVLAPAPVRSVHQISEGSSHLYDNSDVETSNNGVDVRSVIDDSFQVSVSNVCIDSISANVHDSGHSSMPREQLCLPSENESLCNFDQDSMCSLISSDSDSSIASRSSIGSRRSTRSCGSGSVKSMEQGNTKKCLGCTSTPSTNKKMFYCKELGCKSRAFSKK
jgi:hypothetical protein